MINLSLNSLQEFQKRTAYIQRNTVLPILSYLKLEQIGEGLYLTKNNLKSVCRCKIEGRTDKPFNPILLDERILFASLSEFKGVEIQVLASDKQIRITDGKTRIDFHREDYTNYPGIPATPPDVVKSKLTKEHFEAIDIASNYINDAESAGNFQFVHVGNTYISAFNNHFFYLNHRFEQLPELMLTEEQAKVLSSTGLEDIIVMVTRSHYYFIGPNIVYVFTRQEGNSPSVKTVHERLSLPGKDFQIHKAEILGFVNVANVVSETPIADCTMTPAGPFAKLTLVDANYSRNSHREIALAGTFDEFNFNSRLISAPLKSIPYDLLQCKTNQNCLIITGDKEYFCFIGMQKK